MFITLLVPWAVSKLFFLHRLTCCPFTAKAEAAFQVSGLRRPCRTPVRTMRLLPSIALLFEVQSSHAKRDNREGGDAIQARQAWLRPRDCYGDVILYSQEDADKKIGNCTNILGNITISTAAAGEIRIEDSTLGMGPIIFEEAVNCPLQSCPDLNGNLTSLYIGAREVAGIIARANFKALTHISMPNLKNISQIHIEGLKGLETIELPRRFGYGTLHVLKRELYVGSVPKLTTFGSSDYTSTIVSLEDISPIGFFDVGLRTVRLERIDGVHLPTISMEDPGGIQMLKLADGNETFVGGGSASLHYDPADRCHGRLQLSGLSNVSFAQPADGSGYKTVYCREVSFSNNTFSSVVLPFDASQRNHWYFFEMKDNDQLETLHFALERDEDTYAAEFDDPHRRHNILRTINIVNNPKLCLTSYFDIYARHPEAWNWAFTYGRDVTLVGHFDNAFL